MQAAVWAWFKLMSALRPQISCSTGRVLSQKQTSIAQCLMPQLLPFLKGCHDAPNDLMTFRDEGLVLFLGITHDSRVLGYAAGTGHPLALELYAGTELQMVGMSCRSLKRLGWVTPGPASRSRPNSDHAQR